VNSFARHDLPMANCVNCAKSAKDYAPPGANLFRLDSRLRDLARGMHICTFAYSREIASQERLAMTTGFLSLRGVFFTTACPEGRGEAIPRNLGTSLARGIAESSPRARLVPSAPPRHEGLRGIAFLHFVRDRLLRSQ
jgi:hypothetical protein